MYANFFKHITKLSLHWSMLLLTALTLRPLLRPSQNLPFQYLIPNLTFFLAWIDHTDLNKGCKLWTCEGIHTFYSTVQIGSCKRDSFRPKPHSDSYAMKHTSHGMNRAAKLETQPVSLEEIISMGTRQPETRRRSDTYFLLPLKISIDIPFFPTTHLIYDNLFKNVECLLNVPNRPNVRY